MAKVKGRITRPEGGLVSVTEERRKQVRELRDARGWKQEELAARAGCSHATISNLETGRSRQVKRVVMSRIMRALRSPVDEEPLSSATRDFIEGELDYLDERGLQAVMAVIVAMRARGQRA